MPNLMHTFVRDDELPSYWANVFQAWLSTYVGDRFVLTQPDATTVRVVASADDGLIAIAIDGRWRYIEANVSRAHPGGTPGTYDVFVTAADNNVVNTPDPNTDLTDYSFALAIVAHGATPGGVAIYRKVAELQWSGTSITSIAMLVGAASIGATQIAGATAADLAAEASARAAADSTEASTRAAAVTAEASTRASAVTTLQANITAEAGTRASADTALQANITAEAGTRASADTALQANITAEASARTAGDANNPSAGEKAALAGSAGTPGSGNKYVTQADSQLLGSAPVGAMLDYAGASDPNANWLLCDGRPVSRATYGTLFGVIGTTFGPGDGSTTFNLPDLRGRVAVGPDSMGTAQGAAGRLPNSNRARGQTGGLETHAHTGSAPSHTHTGAAPDHLHGAGSLTAPDHAHGMGTANRGSNNGYAAGGGESVAFTNHVHGIFGSGVLGISGATDAADRSLAFTTSGPSATALTIAATTSMQPYQIVGKIIRVA